jgi:large subunit ribosomal protein L37Ae
MTKLKSASRFGPRYGTPLKEIVRDIEDIQKKPQLCPRCNRKSLRRKGYARWVCKKCGAILAGGAYAPQSKMGSIVERIVKKGERYEEIAEKKEEKEEAEKGESG